MHRFFGKLSSARLLFYKTSLSSEVNPERVKSNNNYVNVEFSATVSNSFYVLKSVSSQAIPFDNIQVNACLRS